MFENMTEKTGYGIGVFAGLIVYFFSHLFVTGGYAPPSIAIFFDYLLIILPISAIILGGLIVFKKIHIETTNKGILFGLVGTVAIMEWIVGPFLLQ